MLITFSGLDGSGKSTLIAWLKAELERGNQAVTVMHMANEMGVYAGLRAVRDALLRRARRVAPPEQPCSGERSWVRTFRDAIVWSKPLRRAIYPIDLMIFLAISFFVEKVRRRILVTDRYFYDTLVDVADDSRWFWVRVLERLTPVPDIPVFLDVSPEESFARKGEYSVSYLARRRAGYQRVAPMVPSALVLANADLAVTRRVLRRAIWERLGS